ncbi:MAG: PIN domain-containing protein [Deltaproteobacteria bacterium]|jgi:predicted nucleic acid-binding protein|nr:PIN domain-containing protein [Deltaproteobacteria bacterium]MBW2487768.1 PIN domain-containing protein [Deltaproteobacteria bacterium]
MNGKIFVDTNIFIYAHDIDSGPKHDIAASIIETLWKNKAGIISTQVLQEFYVNVTRKIKMRLTRTQARGVIENYLVWHLELNGPDTILLASEIEERHHLSFWDAMILAAARNAEAEKILTEDLNPGQIVEGILIENPFLDTG